MATDNGTFLALDVGERRIGLAVASLEARLARPVGAIDRHTTDPRQSVQELIQCEDVKQIIVGLPRGLDGQETAQTAAVRAFAADVEQWTSLPVQFQDEALSSQRATAALDAAGSPYSKADIDAYAAAIILTDWLQQASAEVAHV